MRFHSSRRRILGAGLYAWLGLMLGISPASAHEFWVAPEDYTPALGERVVAALKVGQMMEGTDFPYLSDRFDSFTITTSQGTQDAEGNEGDSPALTYTADAPGLHIIAHQASPHELTYDTWEEFVDYLEYEGLGAIAAAHRVRGLPESGFTEAYTRYAKALVQVGVPGPDDRDRALGLALELVTEANPYAGNINALPVVLTWQDTPVEGAQLSVFRRAPDTQVTRTTLSTDANGRAVIPLTEPGEYLLNAVYMEPAENNGEVVWHSHWASLTFKAD